VAGVGASAGAQKGRKLGPDTAKAIQEATLDPTFQTTPLVRIALVPLVGPDEAKDAKDIVARNLVAQLSQIHPEYTITTPVELMEFIVRSKLDDHFNMFLGDFLSAGTVRPDFIATLKNQLQIDAVCIGTMTAYGQTKASGGFGGLLGKKDNVISLEMALYRSSDGRRIWSGKDSIIAPNEKDLPRAAEAIGEVFARFVGRRAYQ
jgi:hypothetical protein